MNRVYVGSHAGSAGLQLAWPLQLSQWRIAPRMGLLYQHQKLDAFSETVTSPRPLAAAYGIDGAGAAFNTLQAYGSVTIARAFRHQGVTYAPGLEAAPFRCLQKGRSSAPFLQHEPATRS